MMKNIIALFTAIVVLLGSFCICYADSNPSISLTDAVVSDDGHVSVNLVISNCPSFALLGLAVSFDSDVLKYNKTIYQYSSVSWTEVSESDKSIRCSWLNVNNCAYNGILATFEFDIICDEFDYSIISVDFDHGTKGNLTEDASTFRYHNNNLTNRETIHFDYKSAVICSKQLSEAVFYKASYNNNGKMTKIDQLDYTCLNEETDQLTKLFVLDKDTYCPIFINR